LVHVAATSIYGAAASLVVLMLWNYYTAQIILVGGEVIKVHHRRTGAFKGSPIPNRSPCSPILCNTSNRVNLTNDRRD
jgi:membrane protein